MDHVVTDAMRAAMRTLAALTIDQRARVLCWWCWCGREIPPGESTCSEGHGREA